MDIDRVDPIPQIPPLGNETEIQKENIEAVEPQVQITDDDVNNDTERMVDLFA